MHIRLTLMGWFVFSAAIVFANDDTSRLTPATPLLAPTTESSTPSTDTSIQPAIGISLPSGANIAVIRIEGFIYGYTLQSLQQRVDQAIQRGATLVVIEIDTPGGLVTSALEVSSYIKAMPIRTVAWINDQALSAGILIASACDQIVMSPASLTGDCAPIVPGQNLSPTERAKALSPILEEFRDSAHRSKQPFAIYHAMCVLGIQLHKVRHTDTGATKIVNQADYAVMVEGKPSTGGWLNHMLGAAAAAVNTPNVAGPSVTEATEADRGKWEHIRMVHDGKTLLTVSQTRAFEIGLSKNDPTTDPIANAQDLSTFYGATSTFAIKPSPVAVAAYWLTRPWMRSILIVVMLIGGYIELQAPGIGAGGISALIALVLLLVAPYLVGLAQLWHVLLFLLGLILIVIEVFVTPGIGVLGITGVLCMFVGLVLIAIPSTGQGLFPMPAPEMADYLRNTLLWSILAVITSGIGFFYITRYFGSIPFLNQLILKHEAADETGPVTPNNPSHHVSGNEVFGAGKITVGTTGTTITPLHPCGEITVDGNTIDVVSLGGWIDADQTVRVVEIQGNRIVVDIHTPA